MSLTRRFSRGSRACEVQFPSVSLLGVWKVGLLACDARHSRGGLSQVRDFADQPTHSPPPLRWLIGSPAIVLSKLPSRERRGLDPASTATRLDESAGSWACADLPAISRDLGRRIEDTQDRLR